MKDRFSKAGGIDTFTVNCNRAREQLMKAISSFFVSLIGVALVLQCGCVGALIGGAAAGAGTYAYVRGELKGTENVPLDKAWKATQTAIKELAFSISTQTKDGLSAKLIAHTAQSKKVEVNLMTQSDNVTAIGIRVGTFGDEDLSRLIMDKIKKKL